MRKRKQWRSPKSLKAMLAARRAEPSSCYNETVVSHARIHDEVNYIVHSARSGITRVVGLGTVVLFSSETGDAWMLDPDDEFALCLMKDGERKPYEIGETDRRFAIQWTGRYRIEGSLFAYIAHDSPTQGRIIADYPTAAILQTIERLRAERA